MSFDAAREATQRTRLANERTYLAWWRTGLTALALCVGVGRIVPATSNGAAWPYEAVGAAFGVVGIAFIAFAYERGRAVERALDRGEYARFDDRLSLALTLVGAALGFATILLVVFAR